MNYEAYKLKNDKDRLLEKSAEISKIPNGIVRRKDIVFEISGNKKTVFGCELFVRAWDKAGEAYGFGDGSIEFERIRLAMSSDDYTYLLVHDEYGDIEKETIDGLKKFTINPEEALFRRLEIVLSQIIKSGDSIVKGKRGNTVTVIDNTAATTSQLQSDNKATYTLARDASTGVVEVLSAASVLNFLHNSVISTTYYVRRAQILFNTSVIGAGQVVSAATLTLFGSGSGGGDANGYNVVMLNNTNNANVSKPLISDDFDQFGTASIGERDLTDFTNVGANVAISFTDFAAINVLGNSAIGLRLSGDINNSTPTGTNVLRIAQSSDFPFLTVTHAAAPSTTIKAVDGVTRANVKTFLGVASASIKTINGIT